jgi:hypothetical protein
MEVIMCGSAVRWDDATGNAAASLGRAWRRSRWQPWEIAAMVLGFIVFWPVGLAILFAILWKHRNGNRMPAWPLLATMSTGNSAFDDWKRVELARLEEERQKLARAQEQFAAFLDQLKRAKDREEFDRFMTERGRPSPA